MNATLEYKELPAAFVELNNEVVDVDDVAIPKGQLVSVCAWCDAKKELTTKLTKAGYGVSHGMCGKHRL